MKKLILVFSILLVLVSSCKFETTKTSYMGLEIDNLELINSNGNKRSSEDYGSGDELLLKITKVSGFNIDAGSLDAAIKIKITDDEDKELYSEELPSISEPIKSKSGETGFIEGLILPPTPVIIPKTEKSGVKYFMVEIKDLNGPGVAKATRKFKVV